MMETLNGIQYIVFIFMKILYIDIFAFGSYNGIKLGQKKKAPHDVPASSENPFQKLINRKG